MSKTKIFSVVAIVFVIIIVLIVIEYLYILRTGEPVAAPSIPRSTQTLGQGPELNYVVLGDSTAVGQGADYAASYAYVSAQHLARNHTVYFTNVGVSGARAIDVRQTQFAHAVAAKPDIVLLAVGANDARRFTSSGDFRQAMQATIDGLRHANPNVKIVVTGCPDMGAIPRFPWPADRLFALRTRQINHVIDELDRKNHLYDAEIAKNTGATFAADPTLFAADKFHPNARGYAVWYPYINAALDKALAE